MDYKLPNIDNMTTDELYVWMYEEMKSFKYNNISYKQLIEISNDSTIDSDRYKIIKNMINLLPIVKDRLGFNSVEEMFKHYKQEFKKSIGRLNEIKKTIRKNRIN